MVQLEKFAALIATDSGGVQKEAFFYSVPCVTLRDETEWVELIEADWNRMVSPTNANDIVNIIQVMMGKCGRLIQPFGDGNSAKKIVDELAKCDFMQ
jgi:UDP-GlcNAc3NAcA epimerase